MPGRCHPPRRTPPTASRSMYLSKAFQRLRLCREHKGQTAEDGRLHGVRGLAVLIVIGSHTNVAGLSGQGALGVWLFFVLSGFLLAQTFFNDPNLIRSPPALLRFYRRRLLRLAPAYWVCVTVLFAPLFDQPSQFLARNLIPIHGWAHLWTIKQEILLYFLLPVLMFPATVLPGYPLVFAGILLVMGVLVNGFLGPDVLTIAGNGERMRFYAFPFFAGIAAAAIRRSAAANVFFGQRRGHLIGDSTTAIFLVGIFLTAKHSQAWLTGMPSSV